MKYILISSVQPASWLALFRSVGTTGVLGYTGARVIPTEEEASVLEPSISVYVDAKIAGEDVQNNPEYFLIPAGIIHPKKRKSKKPSHPQTPVQEVLGYTGALIHKVPRVHVAHLPPIKKKSSPSSAPDPDGASRVHGAPLSLINKKEETPSFSNSKESC